VPDGCVHAYVDVRRQLWGDFFPLPLWFQGNKLRLSGLCCLYQRAHLRGPSLSYSILAPHTLLSQSLYNGGKKLPMCHDFFAVLKLIVIVPPCALKMVLKSRTLGLPGVGTPGWSSQYSASLFSNRLISKSLFLGCVVLAWIFVFLLTFVLFFFFL